LNISTLATYLQLNSSIRTLQRSMLEAQKEMSTGRKADLIAALRDRAAEAVNLRNTLNDTAEFKRSAEIVASRIDTMQTALAGVRDIIGQMRNTALTARDDVSRAYLQEAATAAIDRVNSFLNGQAVGRTLFAGIETDTSPMQDVDTVNAGSGYSPLQAVQQVISSFGPMTDAASAQAVAAGVASIFDDSNADPNLRYTATFYNGATTGSVTTRLDNGYQVDYGVRADDPAIRQVLEGLYMLASVAPGSVPDEAYAAWQDTAITRLVDGYQAVVDLSAQLGFKEAMINDAITRHQATMAQLNNQVADLEAADPYETAMRLSQLQTQLEATFSITARMNELTLTKFL
jgi:flagellar hook-associated protein 3 FlgL